MFTPRDERCCGGHPVRDETKNTQIAWRRINNTQQKIAPTFAILNECRTRLDTDHQKHVHRRRRSGKFATDPRTRRQITRENPHIHLSLRRARRTCLTTQDTSAETPAGRILNSLSLRGGEAHLDLFGWRRFHGRGKRYKVAPVFRPWLRLAVVEDRSVIGVFWCERRVPVCAFVDLELCFCGSN